MWFKVLNSYRTAGSLRDYGRLIKLNENQNKIRSSAQIAAIDDEKFRPLSNLSSYGYNITELPDIKNISEIEKFDIILCDLMGVGVNFDRSFGGASIIKEIKANFPTKFVVAYSGARANSAEASAAMDFADRFIKKDVDITKWVEVLDDIIQSLIDPYRMWIIARQGLIDNEIDIRKIVQLEDAYVRSIMTRDQEFSAVKSLLEKIDIGNGVKSIVYGLISSAIFGIVIK